MKIVNVYDFVGPNGYFFNAFDFNYLSNFSKFYYNFNKDSRESIELSEDTLIPCSNRSIFNQLSNCTSSDINPNSTDTLFLYNLNNNGHLKRSLGLNKKSEKIDKSRFHFISEVALNHLRHSNNFYITIYSELENEIDKHDILKLYDECLRYNIPRNKIIIFSNNINPNKIITLFKNKFKIQNSKEFLFINFNEQLLFKGDELLNDKLFNFFVKVDELNTKKKYRGLFLNKRLREHRLIILSLLANDNLIDKNLISFNMNYTNVDFFEEYISKNHYIRVDEYSNKSTMLDTIFTNSDVNKILNGFKLLKSINKKILDIDDISEKENASFEVDDKSLYLDTYFSIVGETEFFDNWKDYTTEKVIKPIQQFHPFVIIGRPYVLKDLKSYGFKTFSDFWDESYDNIEDNQHRILKVYELIRELINKSDEEWELLYKQIIPILIYNRDILKKYSGKYQRYLSEQQLCKLISYETNKNYTRLL